MPFVDQCGPNCASDFYACLEAQVDASNYGDADMCNRREILGELCQISALYAQKAQQECDFGTRAVFMQIVGVLKNMATTYKHAHLRMIENKVGEKNIFKMTRAVDDVVDRVARIAWEMEGSSAEAKLESYKKQLEKLQEAVVAPSDSSEMDTDEAE